MPKITREKIILEVNRLCEQLYKQTTTTTASGVTTVNRKLLDHPANLALQAYIDRLILNEWKFPREKEPIDAKVLGSFSISRIGPQFSEALFNYELNILDQRAEVLWQIDELKSTTNASKPSTSIGKNLWESWNLDSPTDSKGVADMKGLLVKVFDGK